MNNLLSVRIVNFFACIVVVFLLFAAVYLQHARGLEPCPLCMVQRVAFMGLGILFFLGVFLPVWLPVRIVHNLLIVLCAGLGVVAATRQVWLMHHITAETPSCGADFFYMVKHLPFNELLIQIAASPGECAKGAWEIFGVSMPMWSLLALGFFLLLGVWQMVRSAEE